MRHYCYKCKWYKSYVDKYDGKLHFCRIGYSKRFSKKAKNKYGETGYELVQSLIDCSSTSFQRLLDLWKIKIDLNEQKNLAIQDCPFNIDLCCPFYEKKLFRI